MPSASNERQIRARNRKIAEDRKTDEEVTRALMAHVNGRRWVWLRLSEAQIFVADGNLDAAWMAYMQGRKEFALKLLRDVNRFCPNEYILMTVENTGVSLDPSPEENEEEPSYVN